MSKGFGIEVSGPYACFTRPEMKVERVSYDVITPAAARAIFEAILWKPAIRWHVTRIEVLNPIRWISIRRNEVGSVVSSASVKTAMNAHEHGSRTGSAGSNLALFIEEDRQQRAGLILRDVRYRLYAEFERLSSAAKQAKAGALTRHGLHLVRTAAQLPQSVASSDEADSMLHEESDGKYAAMFERRARKGQCFHQPYLGTREFACEVRWVDPGAKRVDCHNALLGQRDLGFMLFDMDFGAAPYANPQPTWFRPIMTDGVIAVPRFDSAEVMR